MTQIFRITHIKNLPFILNNGLYCSNSTISDPNFMPIGFPTLIEYRKDRIVPIDPGGTLSDYIAFYFWYRSPMLYVINMGNDPEVIPTAQEDIIYIVSSFEALQANNCNYIFTDRHAKLEYANFYNKIEDIDKLNWNLIKTENWGRKYGAHIKEMKQAECLIHSYMPVSAIIGIAVMNVDAKNIVDKFLLENNLKIVVKVKENFYF